MKRNKSTVRHRNGHDDSAKTMTVKEAAEEFGCQAMRLWKAIERGGLVAERRLVEEERVVLRRSDVENYLNNIKPGPRRKNASRDDADKELETLEVN